MQGFEIRRKQLNGVVDVECVFGAIFPPASWGDQQFLDHKAGRVWNQELRRTTQRDALLLTNRDGPRFDKQDVEIAQFFAQSLPRFVR